MTPEQVRERLDTIRAHAQDGDYEAAHGAEDQLWQDVLRAIADGHPKPVNLALMALRSTRIMFDRHTA